MRVLGTVLIALSVYVAAACSVLEPNKASTPVTPEEGAYLDQFTPAIVQPPQEYYVNLTGPGDSPDMGWVKSMFLPLPLLSSDFSIYQNYSTMEWADLIFDQVNQNRVLAGLRPLVRAPQLDAVAQAHSRDMVLRDFFSPTNPEGMTFLNRLQAINPPQFNHLAENRAKGQTSASEVVSEWAASPGFKANMHNDLFEYGGIGVYMDPSDSEMPMHITMDFVQFLEDPFQYDGWIEPGDELN